MAPVGFAAMLTLAGSAVLMVAVTGVLALMQSGSLISQLKNDPKRVVLLQLVILTSPDKVYGNVPAVLTLHNPADAGPTSLSPVAAVRGQLRVTLLAPAATVKVPV
jgi:hypothetical protein